MEEHRHHHDDDDDDDDEHEHHHDDDDDDDDGHGHHHEHEHHHHHHHGEHDADEVFQSWGRETPKSYGPEAIGAILDALEDEERFGPVLRAKGIVPDGNGGWLEFDYVPGEKQIRRGSPEVTGRVCVIGAGLKEEALSEAFGGI